MSGFMPKWNVICDDDHGGLYQRTIMARSAKEAEGRVEEETQNMIGIYTIRKVEKVKISRYEWISYGEVK